MASSTSRWCPNAMNKAWRDRTLRVLVQPTPITFAERRSVLHVLQQRGEIDVFRQCKDKAKFIAVARDEQTAADLLANEFTSYNISVPKNTPDITFSDLRKPGNLDDTKRHIRLGEPTRELGEEDGQIQKNFTVQVTESPRPFQHTKVFHKSPLSGPWPYLYTEEETLMSSILKESLPRNMTAKAFAQWDYDIENRGIVSGKSKRLQIAACLPSRMPGLSKAMGASSVPGEESG